MQVIFQNNRKIWFAHAIIALKFDVALTIMWKLNDFLLGISDRSVELENDYHCMVKNYNIFQTTRFNHTMILL